MNQNYQALNNCIKVLKKSQLPNGGFQSLAGNEDFTVTSLRHTTFATSLILGCLTSPSSNKIVKEIIKRGTAFLLTQKSEQWTFNYWQRQSTEATTMRYPDDLDDTFCALYALSLHAPESLDATTFASIIRMLTATEEKVGGPYNTWIVPDILQKTWSDIDCAVNSNIAVFMRRQEVHLPNIDAFVESCIQKSDYTSRYYHTPFPVLYFISRFYQGKEKERAISFLLSKQHADGTWGNALSTSLAVTSLLNFGLCPSKIQPALRFLIRYAKKEKWSSHPLFIEESKDKTLYMGAPWLTAAFVLEAIIPVNTPSCASLNPSTNPSTKRKEKVFKKKIVNTVHKHFNTFPSTIKKVALGTVDRILAFDKSDSVTLIPLRFKESLHPFKTKLITSSLLQNLGYANLCGWAAYTLFDDCMDKENGPSLLPIANLYLRESIVTYREAFSSFGKKIFDDVMDKMECATFWEHHLTEVIVKDNIFKVERIPSFGSYEMLAYKSFGHALAPLCILLKSGSTADSSEIRHMRDFFTHYLIARQLNDDAHDWHEDLKRGFINSVAEKILKLHLPHHTGEVDLIGEEKVLERVFWEHIIDLVCKDIFTHIKKAKKALRYIKTIKDTSSFEAMLTPVEKAATKALDEKAQVICLIASLFDKSN